MTLIDERHSCNTIVFHSDRNRTDFQLVSRLFYSFSVMKSLVVLIFVCTVLAELQCDIKKPVVCGFKGKSLRARIQYRRYFKADVP